MSDGQPDEEAQYQALRTRIAQADLTLKELEIRSRTALWRQLLTNPILIGGLITAYVTGGTAYLSAQRAREQQRLDELNHIAQLKVEEEKLESSIILELVKVSTPDTMARNVQIFIDIGLIKDRSGRIRDYIRTHAGPAPAGP